MNFIENLTEKDVDNLILSLKKVKAILKEMKLRKNIQERKRLDLQIRSQRIFNH